MPRKQKKYHFIYKTTCKVTGKFYVGMHSSHSMEDGYLGSGKILGYSLSKYGRKNHIREVLEYCLSRDELKQREKEIVTDDLRHEILCMNLAPGGGGGLVDREHAKKFHRAGWESMQLSIDRSDRSAKSCATRRLRGNMVNPIAATEAARFSEKRKITFAERGHAQGEKNSQYGTCWVSDGVKPFKIKKEQLDEYLHSGYSRGRKV